VTVPQITVAVRKHYGGSQLALPERQLGGDIGVAWPTYETGITGASGAVSIMYRKQLAAITDETERKKQEQRYVEEIEWAQDSLPPRLQDIIDPRDTRPYLIKALRWLRNRKQEWAPKKHENIRI